MTREVMQQALDALESRLTKIESACKSTCPKQAVGEMVAAMLEMKEWKYLREELVKPEPEPEPELEAWQPIKTAPKDETRILVCRAIDADGKPIEDDVFGLFVQRAAWWDGEGWVVYCGMIREPLCFFEPTHWMPTPPKPKEQL